MPPQNNSKLGSSTWNFGTYLVYPDFQMSLLNSLTFPGQRQPCTYLILLKTGLDLTLKNGFLDARLYCGRLWHYHSWLPVHILIFNITSVKTSNKHQCC